MLETRYQRIEKMLQRIAVLWFFVCIQTQGRAYKEGYMKSPGGRLRKMGESKMGKLLELNKKQNGEMHTSFTLVGTTQLIFTVNRDGVPTK